MLNRKSLLVGLGILLGAAGTSQAQGVVPGGWSSDVGYQSFGGLTSGMGLGYGWGGTYSPYGGYGSAVSTLPPAPTYQTPPSTVNNLGGLAGVVGRTTMTRSRRARPR